MAGAGLLLPVGHSTLVQYTLAAGQLSFCNGSVCDSCQLGSIMDYIGVSHLSITQLIAINNQFPRAQALNEWESAPWRSSTLSVIVGLPRGEHVNRELFG